MTSLRDDVRKRRKNTNKQTNKPKTETNFTIVSRDTDGLQYYQEDDQIKVNILAPAGDQLKLRLKAPKTASTQ